MKTKTTLRKKIFRALASLTLLGILSFFFMVSCVSMRDSDKTVSKNFEKKGVDVRINHEPFEEIEIRFIETGLVDEDAPLLIFIHGAPGSSNAFDKYLQDSILIQKARMISVDRLGYGYSDYGNAETSIARHAKLVKAVSDKFPDSQKIMLIGHSFGGPVVAKYMMDYPLAADLGLMLAPAVDPYNEKIMGIAYPTKWKATRWMFSGAIKVSSDEKFSHVEELLKMENDWGKIKRPLVHIHGTKDMIVPYENLPFVVSKMPDSLLTATTWEGANHLFVFNRMEEVRDIIVELLDQISDEKSNS
ncbi:MAG: alpha/beta hydrolase [Bacteroidota bacterium]